MIRQKNIFGKKVLNFFINVSNKMETVRKFLYNVITKNLTLSLFKVKNRLIDVRWNETKWFSRGQSVADHFLLLNISPCPF